MAKGDIITEEVREIIVDVYLVHPDWLAKEVMNEVHRRLGKRKSKGYTWPGLISIRKILAEMRKQSPSKEDQPWSIATLQKHQVISPDALPSVLKAWVYAREQLKAEFTVREAKWVGRLCYVLKDNIDILTSTAILYARRELIAEIKGEFSDSFEEDLKLFTLLTGEEITHERMTQILSGPKYGWSREDLEKVYKLIKQIRREKQKYERSHNQEGKE